MLLFFYNFQGFYGALKFHSGHSLSPVCTFDWSLRTYTRSERDRYILERDRYRIGGVGEKQVHGVEASNISNTYIPAITVKFHFIFNLFV